MTGVLLNYIQFNTVFAIGAPFFVVTGLVVLWKTFTFSSDYQQLAQKNPDLFQPKVERSLKVLNS